MFIPRICTPSCKCCRCHCHCCLLHDTHLYTYIQPCNVIAALRGNSRGNAPRCGTVICNRLYLYVCIRVCACWSLSRGVLFNVFSSFFQLHQFAFVVVVVAFEDVPRLSFRGIQAACATSCHKFKIVTLSLRRRRHLFILHVI